MQHGAHLAERLADPEVVSVQIRVEDRQPRAVAAVSVDERAKLSLCARRRERARRPRGASR
ncbi:MAG: hypothetical protein U0269_10400 [Polyangiales bacterium]